MTKILTAEGLCKRYPAFYLDHVSFSMDEGTILGFIGRNGAGKTTTLKSILRFVRPDEGTVTVLGLDMAQHEREIRAQLGFVSGGISYYPRKKLGELTAVTRGFYENWDEDQYQRCLKRFALDENKRVSELSEGMKVKYQLAAALSHRARLLILDEPTSGLDPVSRDELLDLFLTLQEQDGVSILFSSHITTDLEKCAQQLVYIQKGRILASCPLAEFLARWKLAKGAPEALTPTLQKTLIGLRSHRAGFEALLSAGADAPGCEVLPANLEAIMAHLEMEAEA
jgi:ABC-2 type transport system ATP-binding protein